MTLLETLAQDLGDAVTSGVFTLDRDKAKEKLRHFQLADPCAWLLEIVRAAVVLGASHVDVKTDADDVRVSFDGAPITREDVDEIYAALLAKNAPPARAHLAVALNAVMALEPRFVRVESGGPGGVRLEMRPAKPDVIEVLTDKTGAKTARVTTSIHVREQFRAGHFVEFFAAKAGMQREVHELRRACRFASLPIRINGKRIAQHALGISHAPRGGERGALVLLHRGVVLEEKEHPLVPAELHVVVEGAGLARDASLQAFLRDARFDSLLDEALLSALEAAEAGGVAGAERAAVAFGKTITAVERGAFDDAFPVTPAHTRLIAALARRDRPCRNVALFIDARGAGVSLNTVVSELRAHGEVSCVRRPSEQADVEGLFVRLRDERDASRVVDMLGALRVDGEIALRAAETRALQLGRFRQRRAATTLPPNAYLARTDLHGAFSGSLGLRRHGAGALVVSFFKDGCLVGTDVVPCPLPGLSLAIEGPFNLNDACDAVQRDETFLRALAAAWHQIPALLASLPPDLAGGDVERVTQIAAPFLLWALDADGLRRRFLDDLQRNARARTDALDLRALPALPSVALSGADAHPITHLSFLRRADGTLTSLAHLAAQQHIAVVPPDVEEFSVGAAIPAGDTLRTILAQLRPLEVLDERARREARRTQVLRAARPRASLPDRTRAARFTAGAISGAVCVGKEPGLTLELSVDGRAWTTVRLATELGPLFLSVDDREALPLANGDVDGADVERYLHGAAAALPALVDMLVRDGVARLDTSALLWSIATALVPRAELRRAADRLDTAELLALLSLLETHAASDLAALVELLTEIGEPPTAERVRALREELGMALSGAEGSADRVRALTARAPVLLCGGADALAAADGSHVLRAMRARHPGLDGLACREVGGSVVTLSELWKRAAAGPVGFVPAGLGGAEGFSHVVLEDARRHALALLLGPDRLVDKSDEVVREIARRRFETRPVESAALDPAQHLIVHRFQSGTATGEIGLLAPRAGMTVASVRVLARGRFVTRLDLSEQAPCSLAAVIDDPDLPLTADLSGIATPGALARLVGLIVQAADQALGLLCARLRDDASAAALREAHVGLVVLERVTRMKRHKASAELFAQLCGAHVVPNARGGWLSVLELRAAAKDGRAAFIASVARVSDEDDTLVVALAATPGWQRLLEACIGAGLRDAASLWAARAAVRAHQATLPPLPSPPSDALCMVEHDVQGLRLSLWLPSAASAARVVAGADGRAVSTIDLDSPLRGLCGFVDAPHLVAADWRSVDQDALRVPLDDAAVLLARELVLLADTFHPEATVAARALLLTLARTKRELRKAWRSLCEELEHHPLFDIADGARISLATAILERPRALQATLLAHGLIEREAELLPAVDPVTWSARDAATDVEPTAPRAPPAPPAPQPPEDVLRERLEETLKLVKLEGDAAAELLRWPLSVERSGPAPIVGLLGGRTLVNLDAPLVARAAKTDDDPAAFFMLCALLYGAINAHLDVVTPEHERAFLSRLLTHAHSAR